MIEIAHLDLVYSSCSPGFETISPSHFHSQHFKKQHPKAARQSVWDSQKQWFDPHNIFKEIASILIV
jgi:hypothetical protein